MAMIMANCSDETFALMSTFAKEQKISVQEYLSRKVDELVEAEKEFREADEAYEEFLENPVSYSLAEAKEKLGIK